MEEWISKLLMVNTPDWQEANQKTNGHVFLHGYWLAGKKGL